MGSTAHAKYNFLKVIPLGSEKCIAFKSLYLGRSYRTKREVGSVLMEALPGTIILALAAMTIATILGILLGTIAALKKDTWLDTSSIAASVAGRSMPSFFAGLIIAYVFGFLLSKYTGLNMTGSLWEYDPFTGRHLVLKNLILPAVALGIRPLAIITQLTRSALLDVLSQDYIRTAYAKGLSQRQAVFRHALPNALNPVATAISGWLAELLAGSFFIEYIFGWKGIGKLTVDALDKFDFPMVMGSVLLTAFIFIVVNLVTDMLYGWLDPRVRLQK
jgi:peptide/nickel transport system permease protein